MGNKEDLLAAARSCIYERGFAATTARDIAMKAGVSLAAIGYHFGSKDRLLTEAFTEETGREIGDALDERITAAGKGRSPAAAFPLVWGGIAELFERNREALVASLENLVRIQRTPSEQTRMGEMAVSAVSDIAAEVAQAHPELDETQAKAVAWLYFTLLNGLVLQWIGDPEGDLPSGEELAIAVAALAPHG